MMKKRTFITLLAALGICLAACGPKYDDEADFRVSPLDDGKSVEITEYAGNKQTINIPPRLQKLPVTAIEESAFSGKDIISVTIPKGVTTIKDVTAIGWGAFQGNQLTSVTIPDSMTTIGDNSFAENQLASVTIPNSVTTIGSSAFWKNQLTSVTIPDSVTMIDSNAFVGNPLTSITIGANVDVANGSSDSRPNNYVSFPPAYEQNNKKAGTYVFNDADSTWSLQ